MPTFRLSGSKLLAVDIHGETFRALTGSMVAYEGNVQFKKQGMGASGGIKGAFKRKLTGESISLMEVTGQGTCYIANMANEINLVELRGEKMWVEASNLVALDNGLRTDQTFNGLRGASTGQGLFTTTVEGQGTAAIALRRPGDHPRGLARHAAVRGPAGLRRPHRPAAAGLHHRRQLADGRRPGLAARRSSCASRAQGLVYIQPAERAAGIDV